MWGDPWGWFLRWWLQQYIDVIYVSNCILHIKLITQPSFNSKINIHPYTTMESWQWILRINKQLESWNVEENGHPWVASWRMEPRPISLTALSLLECQLYFPSFFPHPILAPAQAAPFLNLWVQKANWPRLARTACYIRPAARHASIEEERCNLGFGAGL